MEEFVKLVEQILYMENFNTEVTPDLKQKFVQLYNTYSNAVPEKYRGDVARMFNKFAVGQTVNANAFSFSY
nr:deoxynucleoside kinase [uncultured Capnocytophaga sp.]